MIDSEYQIGQEQTGTILQNDWKCILLAPGEVRCV